MNIECPHCDTGNTLDFAENINCHKCQKSFKGFSFRKITGSVFSTGLILVGTAIIGQKIDREFFEPKRYPTAAIFEIVSHCSAPRNSSIRKTDQEKYALACVCALDKTMAKISEEDFKARPNEFIKTFNMNLRICL